MRQIALRALAVATVAGGLVGGSFAPAHAAQPRGLTHVSLVLKWLPQAQFAGYYVALKKGYYAKEGLDLTIQPGGPTIVPEQVVANGGADFGIDWLPSLLAEREHGENLVNIAQIYQTTGMRLISFKSQHITRFADLKGKTVGVWWAGNQYQFLACMNKLGINPDTQMKVIHQGFDMNGFLNHSQDASSAMTYNELGVVLEAGIKMSQLNVLDYNQCGVSMLEDGLYAKASWLTKNPDLAVRFLRASIRGWQDVVKDPTNAGKTVYAADTSGVMNLHHQIYMAQQVAPLIHWGPAIKYGIGYMDPVAFNRTATLSLRYKVITKMPVGAYDQSYWKKAISTLNQ
ncbi:MAG TPA: ABC transporter substrate-binding protein [Chloroflexota bacterium]|nr:ABC transporter substrate-binding protein [Chloroflexota bacterium]